MKTILVLAVCLCSVIAASLNKDDSLELSSGNDHSYPVLLSMIKRQSIVRFCGGARISNKWFITAAECLNSTLSDQILITFSTNTYNYIPVPFDLKSVQYMIHPKYDELTKANNLALIKCESCGQDQNHLPSISSNRANSFSKYPAIVTGVLDDDKPARALPFSIHSLQTTIVNPFWCKLLYFWSIGDDQICAHNVGSKGLAIMDIGAPLVVKDSSDGSTTLVGVASSTKSWTDIFPLPMVFTRVTSFGDWIKEVTQI